MIKKHEMTSKNIFLCHFKTGERDGVSLEIEKRAKILGSLGATVFYITGMDGLRRKNACVVEELNAETSYNRFLRQQCFRQPYFDENTMLMLYAQLESAAYKKLQRFFLEHQPVMVFVHNMFSHGCNLPASTALLKILDTYETPAVAVHHDFWYERDSLQKPQYPFIRAILAAHPPKREYILKHQVINSLACEEIQRRRGISAEVIGDYFDFRQPLPQPDAYVNDLASTLDIGPDDIVILHATRITGHKVIENALLFAHKLERVLQDRAPITLSGKHFTRDSRVVILFPNFVEPEASTYHRTLLAYQESLEVKAIWASRKFLPERRQLDGRKIYSFWDSYGLADLVTYTSVQEGFGNQFLEAVYFQKIPVILEYPVFEKDLKHEGYEYVSLGSSSRLQPENGLNLATPASVRAAVAQVIELLRNEASLNRLVEKNFSIARTHHDTTLLQADLEALVEKFV